jgi:hypothetical protein
MVQKEKDDIVYMVDPVQRGVSHCGLLVSHKNHKSVRMWRPSQGTKQDRVDHLGARSERLDVLEAWRGEAVHLFGL